MTDAKITDKALLNYLDDVEKYVAHLKANGLTTQDRLDNNRIAIAALRERVKMTLVIDDRQFIPSPPSGSMYHALMEIASGYFTNPQGNRQRASREYLVNVARRAANKLGYDWSGYEVLR